MIRGAIERALRNAGRSADEVLTTLEERIKAEAAPIAEFLASSVIGALNTELEAILVRAKKHRAVADRLIQTYAGAHPEEYILERQKENVFPAQERDTILRQVALGPFTQYERFRRITTADLHKRLNLTDDRTSPMYAAHSEAERPDFIKRQMTCKTEPVRSMTGAEFAGLVKLRDTPTEYPTEIVAVEHECRALNTVISRKAYQVKVTLLDRTYSWELACPLVAKNAGAPSPESPSSSSDDPVGR